MKSNFSGMHIGVNALFLIPGEVGGSETYLCKTLEAICRRFSAIKMTVFTNIENHSMLFSLLSRYPNASMSLLNFKAGNRFFRILREQTELPVRARKAGIDVLWSPGYTAPVLAPCPQVLSILDMQYRRYPEDLTRIARTVTDLLIKCAERCVQQFITISQFSKSEIIHFTTIPQDKIHVTPLATENENNSQKTKAELFGDTSKWMKSSKPYILAVANSYPHKNLHTLVESFSQLENRIPHRLVIVGKPRLGERHLIESLSRISNPERVIRIHGVPRSDLFSLYRCADLFVLPSLYEGFGLPILEAMMCEIPVITTKMGAIPEVGGTTLFTWMNLRRMLLRKKFSK